MNNRKARWFKWQSGQAMAEYWVTIPASIIILLAAAGLVQFIIGGLLQTVHGLDSSSGLDCQTQPEEQQEGPEYTQLDCYNVQLVAQSYDQASDRTTAAYKVTTTCGQSIPEACTPGSEGAGKVAICHMAGRASEPSNAIVLVLPEAALSAHLDEHGTPLAGHEQDFVIENQDDLEACFNDGKTSGQAKKVVSDSSDMSYWTLGLPANVANKIISSSASYSKVSHGIKFDGYGTCAAAEETGLGVCHVAGRADNPSNYHLMENMPLSAYRGHIDEHGTQQAGHEQDWIIYTEEDRQRCLAGPAGKGGKKTESFISLVDNPSSPMEQSTSTDSTTVFLTFGGYFEWGIENVGIVSGATSTSGDISVPVKPSEPPSEDEQPQECGMQ